ncbi:MAG: hypothetical protein CBC48_19010, partial [bacterium TMED88]
GSLTFHDEYGEDGDENEAENWDENAEWEYEEDWEEGEWEEGEQAEAEEDSSPPAADIPEPPAPVASRRARFSDSCEVEEFDADSFVGGPRHGSECGANLTRVRLQPAILSRKPPAVPSPKLVQAYSGCCEAHP